MSSLRAAEAERRKERQDMSEHGTDAHLDALPEEIAETTANTYAQSVIIARI